MTEFKIWAQAKPYVDVLGLELAVEFILAFGGTEVHISENPQDRSEVLKLVGRNNTIALARRMRSGAIKVPTAKPWLASYFRYKKGMTVTATARKLHVTDVTVRNWLGPIGDQLDLFRV